MAATTTGEHGSGTASARTPRPVPPATGRAQLRRQPRQSRRRAGVAWRGELELVLQRGRLGPNQAEHQYPRWEPDRTFTRPDSQLSNQELEVAEPFERMPRELVLAARTAQPIRCIQTVAPVAVHPTTLGRYGERQVRSRSHRCPSKLPNAGGGSGHLLVRNCQSLTSLASGEQSDTHTDDHRFGANECCESRGPTPPGPPRPGA